MWRKVVPDRDPMPLLETSNNTILPPPPMKTTLHIDKEYIKDMIPTTLFESFFDFFNKKNKHQQHLSLHVSVGIPHHQVGRPISNPNRTINQPLRRAAPRCQSWDLRFCWRLPWRSLESWLCEARGPDPPFFDFGWRLTSHDNLPYPPPPEIRV